MTESWHKNPASQVLPRLPVDAKIPSLRAHREKLREAAGEYVRLNRLAGPLSMDELRRHAAGVLEIFEAALGLPAQSPPRYLEFTAVLLSNEVWRPVVAAVPANRRLLLLPQCLRQREKCLATVGELGLACRRCGGCPIGEVSARAVELGYVVLVAEGSALVTSLVASGRIEAIIGVGCLGVLEQVFPYMAAAAVPGVAIPLLRDGCADTAVDLDWVWDAIYLSSNEKKSPMDLESLHRDVSKWFTLSSLRSAVDFEAPGAGELALEWLARSGKRWRPFLSACVYQSLHEGEASLPEDFRNVALAVECFHKASLIHDDIEDHDEFRYGQKTMHEQHGVPIALNVGDLLLGYGYRLIASCQAPPQAKADMLAVASRGHCELCAGQGIELEWMAKPGPLSVEQVVEIFRRKTAPAFDVALNLAAIYAGADGEVWRVLSRYSTALGVAYQIRDDLDDFAEGGSDMPAMRPSILLAIAFERGDAAAREAIASAWLGADGSREDRAAPLRRRLVELGAPDEAQALLKHYKNQAVESLASLQNARLKTLLVRIVSRIFLGDAQEVMGCCDEYLAGNA
jgi:geranylgeranyl pyrophosphate synthase